MPTPNNGREARATKVIFNNEAGANWLNFLKQLVDEGVGVNVGRDSGTTNGSVRDASFTKGEAAITFNSIAALRGYINNAKTAGVVDVGVAYLPRPAGAKGGVIIGGASLWITDQGTPEQQAAAWDFVKWTSTPEVQAKWSSDTGYYPIRKAAYDVQVMKDTLAQYPQFGVAVEQLHATEPSFPTQGAVFGTFLQTRLAIEAAMEEFISGKVPDAKTALDDAANKSNDALEEYNSTQGSLGRYDADFARAGKIGIVILSRFYRLSRAYAIRPYTMPFVAPQRGCMRYAPTQCRSLLRNARNDRIALSPRHPFTRSPAHTAAARSPRRPATRPREDAAAQEGSLQRAVAVHAAAAEARHLARRIQPRDRLAVGP